jgi:5'-3' exonuclease
MFSICDLSPKGEDMKTCVLVDLNNLMFRTLFSKDVNIRSPYANLSLWRYLVYDSIYASLKHIPDVGEIVLAVDDKTSWRKSYFSRYKESRKEKREKTGINWDTLFATINAYISDLKHHMPFKVIRCRSAEADDVIGVICMSISNPCVISSNDEDYLQLVSDTVKVWNPSKREYMKCDDTEEFLKMLCLMGQAKDDIFNVLTPNNWGQTPETKDKRKPGLGDVKAKKILKEGLETWLEKNDLKEHFKRNQILIDFRKIPNVIGNRIMDAYDNYNFPPPGNMFGFFKKYQMRGFIEDFNKVERDLLRLYTR